MTEKKTTDIWIAPILPGRVEAWRRLCQEFMASRRQEYVASRQRLGILCEASWLVSTAQWDLAVLYLQAPAPYQVWQNLLASKRPFARWYLHQLESILGVGTTQSLVKNRSDRLYCWQTKQ